MRFGKSFQNNDVAIRPHVVECMRVVDVPLLGQSSGKVAVSLVQNEQHMIRQGLREEINFFRR